LLFQAGAGFFLLGLGQLVGSQQGTSGLLWLVGGEGMAERAPRSNTSQAGKGWAKPHLKTRKGKGSSNYLVWGLLQRVLHAAFNLLQVPPCCSPARPRLGLLCSLLHLVASPRPAGSAQLLRGLLPVAVSSSRSIWVCYI